VGVRGKVRPGLRWVVVAVVVVVVVVVAGRLHLEWKDRTQGSQALDWARASTSRGKQEGAGREVAPEAVLAKLGLRWPLLRIARLLIIAHCSSGHFQIGESCCFVGVGPGDAHQRLD
jgi:hypothetical protein